MFTKTVQRVVFALVVVLLLLASFFAGRMYNKSMNVQAQEIPGDEDRYTDSHTCKLTQVAMFGNRIHVRCDTAKTVGTDNVWFFAVANTPDNKTLINRVIAIGLTQKSMGQSVSIYFETYFSANPPGCLKSDCRKLVGIIGYK